MLVYKITNLANGKAYIGVTTARLRVRWAQHLCSAKAGKKHPLYRAIRKYGRESFAIETLYECSSPQEMRVCEKALTAAYGTMVPNGYNLTTGGDGWQGKRSLETRERMRVARLKLIAEGGGRHSGWQHSQEAKERISAAHKGRPVSPGMRQRISATLKANAIVVEQARALAALNHERNRGRRRSADEYAKMLSGCRNSPHTKLNEATVGEVRRLLFAGKGQSDVAKALGLPIASVSQIKARRVWADVGPEIAAALAARGRDNVKLTAEQVADIRVALLERESGASIAKRYGITINTVSSIRTGQIWRDVMPEAIAELARRGHATVKLNAEKAAQIKLDLLLGASVPDLARSHGVDRETVRDIKVGRTWSRVMPAHLSDFILPMGA